MYQVNSSISKDDFFIIYFNNVWLKLLYLQPQY
jgi:hypothetical protein